MADGTKIPNLDAVRGEINAAAGTLTQRLTEWTTGENYQPTAITRDATGVVTSATVTWPDGSAGTLTATNYNATFGVYDGYTITHTTSGKTVTQAAVTRDSNGAVTVKPVLVVN